MWLEGRRFYEMAVADDAVFALPPPLGIFHGKDFVRHMGDAGLCHTVTLDKQHARALGDHVLLVYRGVGTAHDGTQRIANCLSVYRQQTDQWLLCAHQQTPLNGDAD